MKIIKINEINWISKINKTNKTNKKIRVTRVTRITTMLVLSLFLVANAFALEEVFQVQITIERDKFSFDPLQVSITSFTKIMDSRSASTITDKNAPAVYTFTFLDENKQELFQESFLFSFIEERNLAVSREINAQLNFPFQEKARSLEIENQGKKLLSYELPSLCHENNFCGDRENYYSCPADCSSAAADDICIPVHDQGCDPDCGNIDLDCSCGNAFCDDHEHEFSCPSDCSLVKKIEELAVMEGKIIDEEISLAEEPEDNTFLFFIVAVSLLFVVMITLFVFSYVKKKKNRGFQSYRGSKL